MFFRHWASTILAASCAVSVVGCGNSNESSPASGDQTVSAEPAEDSSPMGDAGHEDGDQHADEVDAREASEESHDGQPLEIEGVGSFKTLFAAIKAAGLKDTLSEGAPFTVFAPTDEAFAALPEGTLDDLLKPENKDKLISILTYHVIPGKIMSKDIKPSQMVKTVNGQQVSIKLSYGKVSVDGANVTAADVEADNGVIHVIDTVILPKS